MAVAGSSLSKLLQSARSVVGRIGIVRDFESRLSLALLTGVAILALAITPRAGAGGSLQFVIERPPEVVDVSAGKLAVFSISRRAETRRIGFAQQSDRGALDVTIYGESAAPDKLVPVLLKADARLLWATLSDANRAEVERIAVSIAQDGQRLLADVIQSATFQQKYKKAFEGIVRKASQTAMSEPDVKLAVNRLPIGPLLADREFLTSLVALLAKGGTAKFLDFIRDFGRGLSGQKDDPGERIRVLDSPEARALISGRVDILLRSSEFAAMLTAFGGPFAVQVAGDPETLAALRAVAAEPAFARQLAEMEAISIERAKLIAKLLVGLDRNDTMHPLAATIVRGLILERSGWLVGFMSPDDVQALRNERSGGVIALGARRGS